MLQLLTENARKPLTYEAIVKSLWGEEGGGESGQVARSYPRFTEEV